MQQSNVIFAAIFIAFIVFITLKGELATYIGLLKGNNASDPNAPGNVAGGQAVSNAMTSGINAVQNAFNNLTNTINSGQNSTNYDLSSTIGKNQAIIDIFGGQ